MPRDARCSDAGLPIICPEVFSMSQIRSFSCMLLVSLNSTLTSSLLHEVHPIQAPQHRKEARSLLFYPTAAPPMPITRYHPMLLEPSLHGIDQVMKKSSYTRIALQF